MIPYRSVILGCGGRAEAHAMVYPQIPEIDLIAACDKDSKRLTIFGQKFNIQNLYEDYEEMLEKEKPDIIHIVTQPDFRIVPVEIAVRHNVKAVILEKPVVMLPSEARQLRKISQKSGIKIIVNMQRRYNKTVQNLREVLSSGKIGDIEFVRCITKGNMMCMGPHLMDLLLMCLGDISPIGVWAMVYGAEDLRPPPGIHPAAANFLADYTFPNKTEVFFETSKDTVGTKGEDRFWMHLELDFWGTEGRAWWTQCKGWGYQSSGMRDPDTYETDWDRDEPMQQTEFTRAVATWMRDDSKPHENRLENALRGFDALMSAIKSALLNSRLTLPAKVTDGDVHEMWRRLREREKPFSIRIR